MITEYFFSGLTFVLVGLLLILFIRHSKSKNPKGKESVFAVLWWFSTFIAGFALFFLGIIYQQTPEVSGINYLTAIMNSLTGTFKMFVFDFRDTLVMSLVNDNLIYGIALFLCFICAGLWTQVMVTKLFLGGLVNGVKIFLHSHGLFRNNHTHYIVIGCGEKAELFLLNLKKEVHLCDITVITGEPTVGMKDADDYYKLFIAKGFTVISGKADEATLEKAGLKNTKRHTIVIAMNDSDEQNIAIADMITCRVFERVFPDKQYADLTFQRKAIKAINFVKKSDDDYNLLDEPGKKREDEGRKKHLDLQNQIKFALGQDKKSLEKATKEKKSSFGRVKLEAKIMYSFIERTEHFSFAENAFGMVDFFNPYELRARNFFWKHPITDYISHLIDYNKARLKGDFDEKSGLILKLDKSEYKIKNIFIGFGSTNYQMLRSSLITGQLLGCNYLATIFDELIPDDKSKTPAVRQAMFTNQAHGLFGDIKSIGGDYFPAPKEGYKIEFEHGNVLTRNFYKSVLKQINGNDFTAIYIALGDDKIGVETACELRQTLCESGISLNNVRIYLKINKRSVLNDNSVINTVRNVPLNIECFGFEDEILAKGQIINAPLEIFAKTTTNQSHNTPWEYLSEFERDSNRSKALEIRAMLGLLGFTVKEHALHNMDVENLYRQRYGSYEKRISDLIAAKARINKSIRLQYLDTDNGQIGGKISDTARNNLARREHLRWNTFYLVNGWTMKPKELTGAINGEDDLETYFSTPREKLKLGRKNRLTKQHSCITTFEGLIELRKWQTQQASRVDDEGDFDTVYHDFTLLDDLIERLQKTNLKIVELK